MGTMCLTMAFAGFLLLHSGAISSVSVTRVERRFARARTRSGWSTRPFARRPLLVTGPPGTGSRPRSTLSLTSSGSARCSVGRSIRDRPWQRDCITMTPWPGCGTPTSSSSIAAPAVQASLNRPPRSSIRQRWLRRRHRPLPAAGPAWHRALAARAAASLARRRD